MAEEEVCQICYATELSPENSMIICWNEHTICNECCNRIYTSGRSIKCPFDRGYMFDWRQQSPAAEARWEWITIHHRVTITLRNNQIRKIHFKRSCSVCGLTDHTKRNCPLRVDDYQGYAWYKPPTRFIRQEKGIINLQEGKTWDNQTREIVTDSAKEIKDYWYIHRRKLRQVYRAIREEGYNPANIHPCGSLVNAGM